MSPGQTRTVGHSTGGFFRLPLMVHLKVLCKSKLRMCVGWGQLSSGVETTGNV